MDASPYLLRTYGEILLFAYKMKEDSEKETYCNNVYKKLLALHPGQSIDIEKQLKPSKPELFINCVCLFMQERPNHNVQFSNDYSQIIRTL